jgi:hypothetical protein
VVRQRHTTRRGSPLGALAAAVIVGVGLSVLPTLTPTRGATVTWTGLGATTNWNLGANWSTGSPPGPADVAVFDGTSAKVALINVNISVGGVQVTAAYGGTITQGPARTVTVGPFGWAQAGSVFTGSAAAVTVNGPFMLGGGTFASTSGTLSVSGAFTHSGGTFLHRSGTLRVFGAAAAIDLAGTLTVWNLALEQGHLVSKNLDPADTLVVDGHLSLFNGRWDGGTLAARGPIAAAASFDGGDGLLRIDGSGDQLFTGSATITAGQLPNVVIDKLSGTLTLAGTIRTLAEWTYLAGGLDAGGSTVSFDSGSLLAGSHRLGNVVIRGSGGVTMAAADTLTVDGQLTLTNGTWNGGTLLAAGDLTQAARFDGGDGTLRIGGGGAQLFTGSASSTSGQLPTLLIDKPSGTLTLAGTIRTLRDWTYVGGGLDAGGSTLVFGGALTLDTEGAALNRIQVRGGTATLGGDLSLGDELVITSGRFDLTARAVDVGGALTVAGVLDASGADLRVAGDLLVTGTLVAAGSVITLDGAALQHLDTGGAVLGDLVIDGAVGTVLDDDLHVSGTLDLASGALTLGPRRVTIEHAITGIGTNLVADATSSVSVAGTSAGIHLPASVSDLAELSIETPEGVTLNGPLALHALLNLEGGNLLADHHLVRIVGGAASVSRSLGHVIGTLEKPIAAGGPLTVTFEIGDANGYTPVLARWDAVGADGTLAASTAAGDDDAGLAAVGLEPMASVNRTWTLAPAGLAADLVEITVAYLPSDLDPLADPASVLAVVSEGGASTLPSLVDRTATSATVLLAGVPTATLALAMPGSNLAVTIGGAATSLVGEPYASVVTATNLGAFDADVSVELALDPGTTLLHAIPSSGTCAQMGASIVCGLGSIPAGGSATVDLGVTFNTLGAHQLTARIAAGAATVDPDGTNDIAGIDVVVQSAPEPTAQPTPGVTPQPTPSPAAGELPDTAGSALEPVTTAELALTTLLGVAFIAFVRTRRRRTRR